MRVFSVSRLYQHIKIYFLYLGKQFKINIMKKLLYLFLTVLIVACSSEDGNNSNNNSSSASLITPPAWIQGVWFNEYGQGYTFTPDDFCYSLSSNQQSYCFKAQIDLYVDVPNISTGVEQIISNEFYAIEITIGPNIYNYDGFEKISATQFRYAPTGNETDDFAIYTKQ